MGLFASGLGRLILAVLLAGMVVAARFAFLTKEHAVWIQSYLGYYIVLAAFVWFAINCVQACRRSAFTPRQIAAEHKVGILVIAACSVLLHLHEPHEFRVLHDEPSHVAGSMMMHEERMAVMPGTAHRLLGDLQFDRNFPSFRGYFFQVLLTVVHDFTGYRPTNVFWLNGLLTVALLALLYQAGNLLAGSRGGVVAVLLFSTLPLLAQNATSGGYDVLNLVLILAVFLSTARYLRKPGTDGLDLMLSSAVLLSLTRYESIVYLLVPISAALWKWSRERQITLSAMAVISPLFVLPSFVSNLIMMTTDEFTLAHLRTDKVKFFDPSYIGPHLQQAVYFFFDLDNDGSNSVLLSVAGVIALVGLWISLGLRWSTRKRPVSSPESILALVSLIAIALYGLSLSHFWGAPTDPAAARFSLPLQLVLSITPVWLAKDIRGNRPLPRWMFAVAGVYLFLFTIPTNAKHTVTDTMVVSRSNAWFVEYARSHDDDRTLYVSQSALPMIIERKPAISTTILNQRNRQALRCLRAGIYREILVHRLAWIDHNTGSLMTHPSGGLDPKIVTEVVAERKFRPDQVSQILRFVGVRNEDGTMTTADQLPPPKSRFGSEAEQMQYYINMLP